MKTPNSTKRGQSPVQRYSIYPLSFHSADPVITFWVSFPDKFQVLLEQEGPAENVPVC